MEVFKF